MSREKKQAGWTMSEKILPSVLELLETVDAALGSCGCTSWGEEAERIQSEYREACAAMEKLKEIFRSRPSPQAMPKHDALCSREKSGSCNCPAGKPQAAAGKESGKCEHGRYWRWCYYCAPREKPEGRGEGA